MDAFLSGFRYRNINELGELSFKRVIVITGTPGVGKTALSTLLSERIGASYLDLAKIVKQKGLILGVDEERNSIIADIVRLSERVKDLIRETSTDIVVEGHYAQDVVPSDLATLIFALRRDPDSLRIELEGRGFDRHKVMENVAAEVLGVCVSEALSIYGPERIHEIDMSNMTLNETLEEALRVLQGQLKPIVGRVDWLGKLEEEGRLEHFLKWL